MIKQYNLVPTNFTSNILNKFKYNKKIKNIKKVLYLRPTVLQKYMLLLNTRNESVILSLCIAIKGGGTTVTFYDLR